jgi:hypothetical protein
VVLGVDNQKVKGIVEEVGLIRDEDKFNAFNIMIGLVVDSGKSLNLDQGERLMKQFRKELLGKAVEIAAVSVPCPVCGKAFNTEQGMKQHMRMIHKKNKEKLTTKKKPSKKKRAKKKS